MTGCGGCSLAVVRATDGADNENADDSEIMAAAMRKTERAAIADVLRRVVASLLSRVIIYHVQISPRANSIT